MKNPSLTEALSAVQSGQTVFVHGGAATPHALLGELVAQAERLSQVRLTHLHTVGKALYAEPEFEGRFQTLSLFVGANLRHRMGTPSVDYLPCFLSEIPELFRSRVLPLDVALVHVSPPDRHGFCSLGVSVDVAAAAVQSAKTVIAQVNPRMPRALGDGLIHMSRFKHIVEVDSPIPEEKPRPLSELEKRIGRNAAQLIDDGSTLQAGIGAIPDAVLSALSGHRDLGVHTEMWSDGMLGLIQNGAVTNSRKRTLPGKSVSGFVLGSRAVYDFIHDNPSVALLDVGFVNRAEVIAQNPKAVSINSAVEIDLTGQVCADSIGPRIISGVGGQMDFVRGSTLSAGGKSIFALTSRTPRGVPRIVHTLRPGAGVVTTRAHVHYVVTEYGVADLWGKTLRQRAAALIAIAHPDDRETLAREARSAEPSC